MPQRSITNRYVGPQRRPSINVLKVLEPVRPEERVVYTRLCSRPLRRSLLQPAGHARAGITRRTAPPSHRATSLGERRPPLIPQPGAPNADDAQPLRSGPGGRAHRHVGPRHGSAVTSRAGPIPSDEASPRGPGAVDVTFLGEGGTAARERRSPAAFHAQHRSLRLLIEEMNQSGRCSDGSRP